MMNTLFTYLLEATICLGIFYLFYVVVLRSQPSYQYNRFYLLGTSFVSFIFPLLEIPLYISSARNITGTYEGYLLLNPAEVTQTATIAAPSPDWTMILGTTYLVGFSITLFLFLQQLYRLYQIIRKSTPQHISPGDYQLVYTHGKLPASSFFHYLFWDNTCTLKIHEQQQILAHEKVHIQQKHSYDVLYMSLLKIIFWFNPLVYLYDKALTETHEFAADAGVLKRISPKKYARLLTSRLFDGLELSLVNHFYKSRTLKRIKMMEVINKRTPWYKLILAAPLAAVMFFTFSCQPDEETMAREAAVQSYEEVQADLKKIGESLQIIVRQYYPEGKGYAEVVREKGSEIKALREAGAGSSDLQKFENLIAQRDQLHEKLKYLPDTDGAHTIVEDMPEPEGGMQEFYGYIMKNLKYPEKVREEGIEGRVFVQFIVDEYGELTDLKTLKGIGAGFDEEAIRVLKNAPAWKPGTTDGKPVKVKMVLPITFKLDFNNTSNKQYGKPEQSSQSSAKAMDEIVVVAYPK